MASDDSWIDRGRLQALARTTAWSSSALPTTPAPPSTIPALTVAHRPPRPSISTDSPPLEVDPATLARLEELLTWTRQSFGAAAAWISDGSGTPLVRHGEPQTPLEDHVLPPALACLDALEGGGAGSPSGHFALQVESRFFVMTWYRTQHQRYVLVLSGETAPPGELLVELSLALQDALTLG